MAKKNDEFLKKLLATFRVEADEHLQAMSSGLIELEKTPAGVQQTELVEKIFREAHSLKGAARAVNLTEIESVCHSLESVFAGLKGNRLAISPPLLDLLHQAIERARRAACLRGQPRRASAYQPAIAALIRRLDDASKVAIARARRTSVRPRRKRCHRHCLPLRRPNLPRPRPPTRHLHRSAWHPKRSGFPRRNSTR